MRSKSALLVKIISGQPLTNSVCRETCRISCPWFPADVYVELASGVRFFVEMYLFEHTTFHSINEFLKLTDITSRKVP